MKRLLVMLAALVMTTVGCGSASDKADSKKLEHVKVMLDWTPNTNHTGMYVAQQRGYYKDQGLEVEFVQPGEQGGLANLGSGTVDFAVSFQESLIPARAQGVPVVSIGAVLTTNTSSLLAPKSENITRLKDLEGKTYGGSGGDLEKALISSMVKCDGGDPGKVKWANVGETDYRVGFERGNFDFIWAFDGWGTIQLKDQGVDVNTIAFRDHFNCIPDWYTPLLATSEKMVKEKPETVKKFMEATAHGYRDAITDPKGAAGDLLKGAPELDANLVQKSAEFLAKFYAAPNTAWGVQKSEIWTGFNDYMHTEGIVKDPVEVKAAYTNQFVPDVKVSANS